MADRFDFELTEALDAARAARMLIAEHRYEALVRAMRCLAEMQSEDDAAGAARWTEIVCGIAGRQAAARSAAGASCYPL
jgi:hypothetical protein